MLQWLQLPGDQRSVHLSIIGSSVLFSALTSDSVSIRPDFFTLYLEEPDKSGHSYGPDGEGVSLIRSAFKSEVRR